MVSSRSLLACFALVAVTLPFAQADEGDPKPSEIPAKLAAQAKKAFAQKLPYFIWTEKTAYKPPQVKLLYAANPDVATPEAHTQIKFFRRVPSGMMVPYTGTRPGIVADIPRGREFLGKTTATVYLINALDVVDAMGNVKDPEKAKPISNEVKVQITFE